MSTADLKLYDSTGKLVALVEAKAKRGTTPRWAAEFRRNILAHGDLPPAKFFLMVTPDQVYLWDNATSGSSGAPNHVVSAEAVLAPFFEKTRTSPESIGGDAFEMLVGAWLSALSRSAPDVRDNPLEGTGFPEAITGGRLEHDVAA